MLGLRVLPPCLATVFFIHFFHKEIVLIYSVYECFSFMYVCVPCLFLVLVEIRTKCVIPCNWSYKRLWSTMWFWELNVVFWTQGCTITPYLCSSRDWSRQAFPLALSLGFRLDCKRLRQDMRTGARLSAALTDAPSACFLSWLCWLSLVVVLFFVSMHSDAYLCY